VVSLQGLTHFFVRRDFSVLSRVTQHVRPGGYLVLVDEFTPTDATHLAEGLDRAELEIVGTGMVGAPGGVYCALITRRTHGTAIHGTAATRLLEAIDIVSQEVWPIFQGYCDVIEANDPSARDKMNSAYFGYARDSVIMF
jgi:hypothetical protein